MIGGDSDHSGVNLTVALNHFRTAANAAQMSSVRRVPLLRGMALTCNM